MRVDIAEVTSNREHDVVRSEMIGCLFCLCDEFGGSEGCIELCIVRIVNGGTIVDPVTLEVKVLGGPINVVDHHESKKLGTSS